MQRKLLEGVERVVHLECQTSGVTQKPTIKNIMHAPATINDLAPYEVLNQAFQAHFQANLCKGEPKGASEDFSTLATACGAPYLFWNFGCVGAEEWAEAESKSRTKHMSTEVGADVKISAPKIRYRKRFPNLSP